ncbi:hypothetical protein FHG87_009359 [Trinorchestia longiramus]|nr:hypothetical protein FHG87_009359 [Trinorchestia longiramus]
MLVANIFKFLLTESSRKRENLVGETATILENFGSLNDRVLYILQVSKLVKRPIGSQDIPSIQRKKFTEKGHRNIFCFCPKDFVRGKELKNASEKLAVVSVLWCCASVTCFTGRKSVSYEGVTYVSSTTGDAGVSSSTGNAGVSCSTGNTHVTSNTSNTRVTSNTGNTGVTSNTGNTGVTSNTGNTGVTSNTGNTGVTSNTGNTGVTSNTVNTGVISNTVNTGVISNTGNTGVNSNTGNTGGDIHT